jgi:transposase
VAELPPLTLLPRESVWKVRIALESRLSEPQNEAKTLLSDPDRPTVERVLLPALKPGQIVVMDNLSAHKGSKIRDLIERRGYELLFLPPYSPDLNPIEEAFAKVKALLRRAGARTRETWIEAMGRALEAVAVLDARGFFGHCGYRLQGSPL